MAKLITELTIKTLKRQSTSAKLTEEQRQAAQQELHRRHTEHSKDGVKFNALCKELEKVLDTEMRLEKEQEQKCFQEYEATTAQYRTELEALNGRFKGVLSELMDKAVAELSVLRQQSPEYQETRKRAEELQGQIGQLRAKAAFNDMYHFCGVPIKPIRFR